VIKEWNVASSNNEQYGQRRDSVHSTELSNYNSITRKGMMVWVVSVRYIGTARHRYVVVALESTACTKVGIGEHVQILDGGPNARQNPGRTLGWRSPDRPMVVA
jgi:hypothetical protein